MPRKQPKKPSKKHDPRHHPNKAQQRAWHCFLRKARKENMTVYDFLKQIPRDRETKTWLQGLGYLYKRGLIGADTPMQEAVAIMKQLSESYEQKVFYVA